MYLQLKVLFFSSHTHSLSMLDTECFNFKPGNFFNKIFPQHFQAFMQMFLYSPMCL
uniref:Uncharacterized protein n=1 Tax=Octopus bimaculoides TaxID=37653 RepID=A0A0L8GY37_OCTBM